MAWQNRAAGKSTRSKRWVACRPTTRRPGGRTSSQRVNEPRRRRLRRRGLAAGGDGLGHAKDGREHLERNPAVKNPEEISNDGAQQRQQSLHGSFLEGQHHAGHGGNESGEQVHGVEKLQHARRGVRAERKIHQTFPHPFGFRHRCASSWLAGRPNYSRAARRMRCGKTLRRRVSDAALDNPGSAYGAGCRVRGAVR